ncbi:hypothetical protein NC652_031126 [Populus alba x Populus x berolinensis]|nr:hypothetical protein NC652_031126 [Populus alba x Populus x berolinensis]
MRFLLGTLEVVRFLVSITWFSSARLARCGLSPASKDRQLLLQTSKVGMIFPTRDVKDMGYGNLLAESLTAYLWCTSLLTLHDLTCL